MNPSEQDAVTKTLARLGSVAIPDGLEQRILTRLATHAANQPVTVSPRTRPAAPWLQRPLLPSLQRLIFQPTPRPVLRAGMALAGVALAVASLRYVSTLTPTAQNKVQTQPGIAHLRPTVAQPAPILSAASSVARSLTRASRPTTSPSPSTPVAHATVSLDEALALAELRAPSQLVPPLPLTADERALQHLAQHSSPETLLSLDSARRAVDLAAEQAAFVSFFTPPLSPDTSSKETSLASTPN